MAVRSRPLAVATVGVGGAANTLVYTVPADRLAIVKNIRLRVDVGAGTATLLAYDPGTGTVVTAAELVAAAAGASLAVFEDWLALSEGQQLYVLRSATTFQASCWLSGALLDGDPS